MRQWRLFAALALAGLGGWPVPAASMEEPNSIVSMDEICGLVACRKPTTVRIRGATAAADADMAIPRAPHVFQGVINLLAGERNAYALDVREDEVRDIRRFPAETPGSNFWLSLGQPEDIQRGRSEFRLSSKLDHAVTFRLSLVRAGRREPEPDLECQAAGGQELILQIQFPVVQAFVVDLDIAKDGAALAGTCRPRPETERNT